MGRKIKTVWRKEIRDGLCMGKRAFLGASIFVALLMIFITVFTFTQGLLDVPDLAKINFFRDSFQFVVAYQSISIGFLITWIFSFQLFALEKEENIYETLLSGPLGIHDVFFGKILAFTTVFLPIYFGTLFGSLVGIYYGGLNYLPFAPALDIPFLSWVIGLIISPLLGVGLCLCIGVIQLRSSSPRGFSMGFLFIAIGYSMGVNILKKMIGINYLSLALFSAVASFLILLPYLAIKRNWVTKERIVTTG